MTARMSRMHSVLQVCVPLGTEGEGDRPQEAAASPSGRGM